MPAPVDQHFLDLRQDVELFGHASQTGYNGLDLFFVDGGRRRFRSVFRLKYRGRFFELRFLVSLGLFDRSHFVKSHVQPKLKFGFKRRQIVRAQHPGFEKIALVERCG